MADKSWNPGFLGHSLGHTAIKTEKFKAETLK